MASALPFLGRRGGRCLLWVGRRWGRCWGDAYGDVCPQPSFEAYFTEILLCKNELNNTLNNLSHWMKDEHVDKNLVGQQLRADLGREERETK